MTTQNPEGQTPETPAAPTRPNFNFRSNVQTAVSILLTTWKKRVGYPETGAHSRHLTVSLFRLGIRAAVQNGVTPETLGSMFQRALNDELFQMLTEAKIEEAMKDAAQQVQQVTDDAAGAAEDADLATSIPAAPAAKVDPGTTPDTSAEEQF